MSNGLTVPWWFLGWLHGVLTGSSLVAAVLLSALGFDAASSYCVIPLGLALAVGFITVMARIA